MIIDLFLRISPLNYHNIIQITPISYCFYTLYPLSPYIHAHTYIYTYFPFRFYTLLSILVTVNTTYTFYFFLTSSLHKQPFITAHFRSSLHILCIIKTSPATHLIRLNISLYNYAIYLRWNKTLPTTTRFSISTSSHYVFTVQNLAPRLANDIWVHFFKPCQCTRRRRRRRRGRVEGRETRRRRRRKTESEGGRGGG